MGTGGSVLLWIAGIFTKNMSRLSHWRIHQLSAIIAGGLFLGHELTCALAS